MGDVVLEVLDEGNAWTVDGYTTPVIDKPKQHFLLVCLIIQPRSPLNTLNWQTRDQAEKVCQYILGG